MTDASTRADQLRARLADDLVASGIVVSSRVEAAVRTVPRHLFTPGSTLEDAYAQDVVVTKRDERGVTISSVSAPEIQAMMLEQADLRPGMCCLEIGSGGYNAALMAELVGEVGMVTTIDIDPDVTDRARSCLTAAGYRRVSVARGDGEYGYVPGAPYDRILVTVGAWDIPPAWTDQLADGGTLTVPLRIRGLTRSVTLVRDGGRLLARLAKVCGFVAMQGEGAHRERLLWLRGGEVGLRFDDDGPDDADALVGALDTPRVEVPTGVTVERFEPFDTLQLWLATRLDGFCLLSVDPDLDTGTVTPQNGRACLAAVNRGSLAYLAIRRDGTSAEFIAHAFGPDAAALADAFADQIRAWGSGQRGRPGPEIAVYPIGTPDSDLPAGMVLDKRHVRVTVSWSS
jgi:protein-L-isoaspartate(D-aspartate) O-methyltransferase